LGLVELNGDDLRNEQQQSAVWKFLDRHGQTHKKRLPMPASKNARM
jgi:hypothetical protein